MAGIISNVDSDVQKLRKLKNEIESVKKALKGINIKVDIDIAKGLQSQLTSLLGQYDTLVDKIAAAEGKIMLSASRISKATEKIVKAQEAVSKPTAAPTQNGDTARQTNMAETESIQAQAKAYEDLKVEINNILGTRGDNVKRMMEEINAIRLINAEIKQITKSQGEYSSLSSNQQKRLEQLNNSLLTHKAALSDLRQTLNNNAKLDNATATSMNGLSQSLSRMKIAYRELTEAERNSAFGKELLASINQADAKIKELDATIGNHQRNVGNYGKQWNGLSMSIQQVGRELPSLAYGPKVFFSAISNNLPILADEIKRARTEYELLKKSGQAATPVWKQVVSSLFSWQSALTVGITLLTLYGDKVVDWVAGLFNAKNAMKPLVNIQQQLNEVQLKGTQNAQSEITKLELLYKATQNASKPIRERKKAVDELQKLYPDFFKNLSEEEILTGKAADTYARLTSSIIASARARAAQDKMTENAKKILENETKITEEYAKREAAQLKLDKQIELRNKIDRESNPDEYAGQQMLVGAALSEVNEIDKRITKLRREIYEKNKEQYALSQNIDINDLIFNPNEDSSKVGEEERKRRQEEAEKLLKQQEQLSEQLLSLRRKNLQDEINLKEEGNEKKIAQIKADFESQKQAIEKQANELAKANKEAGVTNLNKNGLTQEQQSEVDKANYLNDEARKKSEREIYRAEIESMRDYLKEYGTFQQQKLAIAEEYAEKIHKAQTEGERLSLEKQRNSELLKVDAEAAKQSIDWQSVFGDLGMILNDQIQPTIDNLKRITQSDEFKNASIEDQRQLFDILSQLESQSGSLRNNFKQVSQDLERYRNSVNAYNDAYKRQEDALNKLIEAQKRLKKAQDNGGDVKAAQQAVDEAKTEFDQASESVNTLGKKASENANALQSSAVKTKNALNGLATNINKLKSGSLAEAFDGIKGLGKVLGGKLGDAIANIDPTGIIGGILTIMDVLKDGVSEIFVSLQDTIFGAIEGILNDVLSGEIITKTLGNSLSHIGNILNTVTFGGFNSWFGIGGNGREVEEAINRLSERNEALQTSIEDLTDEMKASKGTKSVAAYKEAYKYQEETNANYKRIAQEQARYSGSHHSWGYYWGGFSQEQVSNFSKKIGREWNGDIWNLTPEEMKMLRETIDMWEQIQNSGKGGYGDRLTEKLDDYIEQAGKLDDLTDKLYEGLTGISFDSMYDNFVSSLMDMEKSAEDVADDISQYFMQAMLSNAIGEQFSERLRAWYDSFGEAMKNDGTLDPKERENLKNDYIDMVDEAMKLRDELAAATGYDSQKITSQQKATAGGFETMSQDTATELNGRFTALQIAGEEIKSQSITQSESLNLLTMKADSLLSIGLETRNIADETRDIMARSYIELIQISENTGAIVKPILKMQADIAEVKKNTSKL